MENENFSPQQSIELIRSMISKTRNDIGADGNHFLLWGWITFVAFVGQFTLKHIFQYEKHYLVWLLIIPGIITAFWMGFREKKKQKVTTYISESMKFLWMGMGISFFVLSAIFGKMGWDNKIFPFFMLLYGLGTFVSGKFLQFPPMVYGAVMAWVLAVASTYFDYDYQMLFGAAAILFSYIIPAYMLRRKSNSSNNNH